MPRSPFEICFDHVERCDECDYGARRLCLDGRLLFNAALEACKMIAGASDEKPKAQA
jgi:hypothetical protein